MGKPSSDSHIWVLDHTKSLADQIEGVLGGSYRIKSFADLDTLRTAIEKKNENSSSSPLLIIRSDPRDSSVLEFLQKRDLPLRFMMVSDCNDLGTISSCLELGASDYLLHPVDKNLMAAKVMYLLRQGDLEGGSGLILDAFSLFVRNETGLAVKLTPKELQLLSLMEQAHPEPVSPGELRALVWGEDKVVTKALDVHLFKLRKKLEILGFEIVYRSDRYWIVRRRSSR